MESLQYLILPAFIAVVMIYRQWKEYEVKRYAEQLLRQLRENPAFSADIAAEMQHRYGFEPYENNPSLRDMVANVAEGEMLGEFEILRKIELPGGDYLFVTLCHEKNYTTDKYGKQHMHLRYHQMSFRVSDNAREKTVGVWSDYYVTLEDKFLRQAFARELFRKTPLQ